METLAASPASTPAILALPPCARALASFISLTVVIDDVSAVCEWFNLPLPSEYPTPGQAKTWGRSEWGTWGNEHGYEFHDETAHSWTWKHKVSNKLVISVAKTPGDWRSPMAMATETRRAARTFIADLNFRARAVLLQIRSDTTGMFEKMSEDDLRTYILENKANSMDVATVVFESGIKTGSKTIGDIMKLLNRIKIDFDISYVKAFTEAVQMSQSAAQQYIERIKLLDPTTSAPEDFIDQLKDYLDYLRELDRTEKEAKRIEREAKAAEIEAKRAFKERVKTPKEILQDHIDAHNSTVKRGIQGCLQAAMSTLDRLRALEAQSSLVLPTIEDAVSKAALEAKDAELAAMRDVVAKLEAQNLLLEQQKMPAEEIAALRSADEHLKALASLVVDTVNGIKNVNPFQMADMLNNLSHSAQEFVPTMKAGGP